MKWVSALGLTLQFLAFWFAAPELLGQKTLKRLEDGILKLLSRLPVFLLMLVVLTYTLYFTMSGINKGIEASEHGISQQDMIRYYVVLGLAMAVYFVFILAYKRIFRYLEKKVARPLTRRIIHNKESRRSALAVGAVLFTLGFLLQLFTILV